MSSIKKYRISHYNLQNNDFNGAKAIVAELFEVKDLNISEKFSVSVIEPKGEKFVFSANSKIGKRIMESPKDIFELDLSDFREQRISLDNYNGFAFFHKTYLKQEQNIQYFNDDDDIIQEIIEECILMHHTDTYFMALFRSVISIEYKNKEKQHNIILNEVFEKYKKLCSYAIERICSVQIPEFNLLTNEDITTFKNLYHDEVEYGTHYLVVLASYVDYRKDIKLIIESELKDKEPFYPKFVQNCMLSGYEHALQRINNNLRNSSFFDHEFIKTNNSTALKIFLTPHGFIHKEFLVDLAVNGKINDLLDDYLGEFGIQRIIDENLKKELKTSSIFEVPSLGRFYYKRRPINDEYVPFGEQDRKIPMKNLLVKGQLNLTLLD
jgi:hypothetical protein